MAMEAHVAGYTTWLNGGDHEDVIGAMVEAGAIAFISASANYAIGQKLPMMNSTGATPLTRVGNVLAHAALGCAMAEAGGGKCGAGALSAAITAGTDQIDTGSFGGGMAMVVGCVGTQAGGGSRGTGAASSAVIYLYNTQGCQIMDSCDLSQGQLENLANGGNPNPGMPSVYWPVIVDGVTVSANAFGAGFSLTLDVDGAMYWTTSKTLPYTAGASVVVSKILAFPVTLDMRLQFFSGASVSATFVGPAFVGGGMTHSPGGNTSVDFVFGKPRYNGSGSASFKVR